MLTDKQKELIKNLDNVKASAKTRTEYNAYQQMLTRIRKFGYDAIEDLLYLIEKLPEDELNKIFTDERIKDIFMITERSLDVADWKYDESTIRLPEPMKEKRTSTQRSKTLRAHLEKLLSHYFSEDEYEMHDSLIKEYSIPSTIEHNIIGLKIEKNKYLTETEQFKFFLKEEDLLDKYEVMRQGVEEKEYRSLFEKVGFTDEQYRDMGLTEEQIKRMRERREKLIKELSEKDSVYR